MIKIKILRFVSYYSILSSVICTVDAITKMNVNVAVLYTISSLSKITNIELTYTILLKSASIMADIRDAWGKDGENPPHVLLPVHVIYKLYISQINLFFLYRLTIKLSTFLDDDSAPFMPVP
jgi:hypothetical protein